jgi:hypothetical protein
MSVQRKRRTVDTGSGGSSRSTEHNRTHILSKPNITLVFLSQFLILLLIGIELLGRIDVLQAQFDPTVDPLQCVPGM